jgi:hypothetical protein
VFATVLGSPVSDGVRQGIAADGCSVDFNRAATVSLRQARFLGGFGGRRKSFDGKIIAYLALIIARAIGNIA